jgi:NTP pyrophosphatase (non-canonical NTP hydrolase)
MTLDKPELTKDQVERLIILSEECSEVIQIVNKILRFGTESRHPIHDTGTNSERLHEEIRDVLVAVLLMIENGDIIAKKIDWGKQYEKRLKMSAYMNFQLRSPKEVQYEFWAKELGDDFNYERF